MRWQEQVQCVELHRQYTPVLPGVTAGCKMLVCRWGRMMGRGAQHAALLIHTWTTGSGGGVQGGDRGRWQLEGGR